MKRILLVESDFYVRVQLDDHLDEHGFQVVCVKRVRDAMMKLRTQVFQVLLTSYEDDFIPSLRLLATLRATGNQLPVVVVTKRPTQEQLMQMMEYRPLEVLVKPYSMVELVQRLEHLCTVGAS